MAKAGWRVRALRGGPEAGPETRQDLARAYALRVQAYGARAAGEDRFDASAEHLLVEDGAGNLWVTARYWCHGAQAAGGRIAGAGYAAAHYDLGPLAQGRGAMFEFGRLAARPGADWRVLHLLLGHIARLARAGGADLILGCVSLAGADPLRHAALLAHLARHHQGPPAQRPRHLPPGAHRFARDAHQVAPQDAPQDAPGEAPPDLPDLLRLYLSLGAWVSDHGHCDRALDTFHLLACLDLRALRPAQAALLARLGAR